MKYRGQTLTTSGLGAAISQATERGDFHVLAAAVGLMAEEAYPKELSGGMKQRVGFAVPWPSSRS